VIQHLSVRTLSTAALTLCLSLLANAAEAFTFSSTGKFHNPLGDSGSVIYYETVSSEERIRWGSPASSIGSSGLGYSGFSGDASFDDVFVLGRLRHFNNPIFSGSAIRSLDLSIDLSFGGDIPSFTESFTFTLNIDETPNSAPCAYPGSTLCPDKISWASLISSNSFEVDDTVYTLELLGFSPSEDGGPINEFISDEGATNTAYLFGRVVESRNAAVPEPTTVFGLMLAGAGVTYLRRRQKNVG